jgi:hypothetical protein
MQLDDKIEQIKQISTTPVVPKIERNLQRHHQKDELST